MVFININIMNNFYRPLEIPVPLLKKNINEICIPRERHTRLDRSDISDLYYSFMENLGIKLVHAELIFSLPNRYYDIHQDNSNKPDLPKINFVYEGIGSKMNWYKIKEGREGKVTYTDLNTKYTIYQPNDVDLIFSQEIKSPVLIQAGVPHNVFTPTYRWAVSTVYTTKNDKVLSWNEMCNIFKDYILYA